MQFNNQSDESTTKILSQCRLDKIDRYIDFENIFKKMNTSRIGRTTKLAPPKPTPRKPVTRIPLSVRKTNTKSYIPPPSVKKSTRLHSKVGDDKFECYSDINSQQDIQSLREMYEQKIAKINQENSQLKDSLITRELDLKNKEEELKYLEEEYHQKIEEAVQEQKNKIMELQSEIKVLSDLKNEMAIQLEKVGVNPISLQKFELSKEDAEIQKKKAEDFKIKVAKIRESLAEKKQRYTREMNQFKTICEQLEKESLSNLLAVKS